LYFLCGSGLSGAENGALSVYLNRRQISIFGPRKALVQRGLAMRKGRAAAIRRRVPQRSGPATLVRSTESLDFRGRDSSRFLISYRVESLGPWRTSLKDWTQRCLFIVMRILSLRIDHAANRRAPFPFGRSPIELPPESGFSAEELAAGRAMGN